MKKTAIIWCFLATCALPAFSQGYNTAIGVRLGSHTSGLTFRGFTNPESAIEGILGVGHKTVLMTALYEKFLPVSQASGLQWFYGGGVHLGFFREGGRYYYFRENGSHVYVSKDGDSRVVPGIDIILGLDYKFANAPVNLGLDIKPFMDIVDGTELYLEGAFNFRFAF